MPDRRGYWPQPTDPPCADCGHRTVHRNVSGCMQTVEVPRPDGRLDGYFCGCPQYRAAQPEPTIAQLREGGFTECEIEMLSGRSGGSDAASPGNGDGVKTIAVGSNPACASSSGSAPSSEPPEEEQRERGDPLAPCPNGCGVLAFDPDWDRICLTCGYRWVKGPEIHVPKGEPS